LTQRPTSQRVQNILTCAELDNGKSNEKRKDEARRKKGKEKPSDALLFLSRGALENTIPLKTRRWRWETSGAQNDKRHMQYREKDDLKESGKTLLKGGRAPGGDCSLGLSLSSVNEFEIGEDARKKRCQKKNVIRKKPYCCLHAGLMGKET